MTRWLETIETANQSFLNRIDPHSIPAERKPCSRAVITCMDPRINLEAIGIDGFSATGGCDSSLRIIRTIGAIHEQRSLVIGIHLAGIREIAVLMHTDCGCCLAHHKTDVIEKNLRESLDRASLEQAAEIIGDLNSDSIGDWLKTFDDPRDAVRREVAAIRQSPFVSDDVIVHGLVYDVTSGEVESLVNGYEEPG